MSCTDERIIKNVIGLTNKFKADTDSKKKVEYPLDEEIVKSLESLKTLGDDEFSIFKRVNDIKKLWKRLIEKAIICLRYYDGREPFIDGIKKKPQAYGVEDLEKYFESYSSFEELLYGGSKYYRDHVIHVFRVWLLGIELLLKDSGKYLKIIRVAESSGESDHEKLSIWTIIALTHDLGYPLEKAFEIVEKTKDMMKAFVVNPIVTMDLSFSGVQNSMNDYVLRFISSKMREIPCTGLKAKDGVKGKGKKKKGIDVKKCYVARLQPKYYYKFQKSLEQNKHGILSALIIYKLLIYFLESDYSINEDYQFDDEDVRQFNIRREILRSIASHTCHDVYQLRADSFSLMLILCDDAQEWGRKYLSELYVNKEEKYEYQGVKIDLSEAIIDCSITDSYVVESDLSLKGILSRFEKQSKTYRDIFRDGQDTKNRNFNFARKWSIDVIEDSTTYKYAIELLVSTEKQTSITVRRVHGEKIKNEERFYKEFKDVFKSAKLNSTKEMITVEL